MRVGRNESLLKGEELSRPGFSGIGKTCGRELPENGRRATGCERLHRACQRRLLSMDWIIMLTEDARQNGLMRCAVPGIRICASSW